MLLSSISTTLMSPFNHFFFFEMTNIKAMAILLLVPLLSLLFVSPTPTLAQSNDPGHISVLVSETGLDFAKDFLINEVISTTIPLQLPDIEKKVKIPLLGKVQMGLSDIQIYAVDFQSSWVETGEDGIFLGVSGAIADLRINWSYTYSNLFFKVSDHGNASAKVKGMDVQVAVTLLDQNGSLRISSIESNCKVKSIAINIKGGASWLYQGVVDAFQNKIISTVETTVSKKIEEKMKKLDSLLQSLPKTKKIDDYAAVNLTFTSNLLLSDSFVEVKLNGLFIPNDDNLQVQRYHQLTRSQPSSSFRGVNRMTTISIDEEVFNSATLVYFSAKRMHMDIEKTKNGSVLNTTDLKLILPKLYRQYPDAKMVLNMLVTSPPSVMITEKGINATIHLDTTINIQDSGEILPVACISSVLNVSCSAEIDKNNLAGRLELISFSTTMKWSKLGELEASCVQAATSRILEALFLPYINTRLKRGFPLPIPRGFAIENTEIVFVKSSVMVCSDIVSKPDVNSFKILTSEAAF